MLIHRDLLIIAGDIISHNKQPSISAVADETTRDSRYFLHGSSFTHFEVNGSYETVSEHNKATHRSKGIKYTDHEASLK